MKKIVLLMLLCLTVSLFGCNAENSFNSSKTNLNYSEQFVSEEFISSINKPQIVIAFKYTFDNGKPEINEKLTVEQVQEIIRQQRKENKEFYSKINQELFESMTLDLENEKVYISTYSNCVFIELDENKSNSFYSDLIKNVESYDFVNEVYLK